MNHYGVQMYHRNGRNHYIVDGYQYCLSKTKKALTGNKLIDIVNNRLYEHFDSDTIKLILSYIIFVDNEYLITNNDYDTRENSFSYHIWSKHEHIYYYDENGRICSCRGCSQIYYHDIPQDTLTVFLTNKHCIWCECEYCVCEFKRKDGNYGYPLTRS